MRGLVKVQQLFKTYGNGAKQVEVLKGIDLTFLQGERAAIVGASGAGKTTLLHILGTLDRPTSGKVLYEGKDIFTLNEKELALFRNREIGFVFQFHHLLPEFSALENTMMPCLIRGMSKKEGPPSAESILSLVGLKDRLPHKPGELSGGNSSGWRWQGPWSWNLKCSWPTNRRETSTPKSVKLSLTCLKKSTG